MGTVERLVLDELWQFFQRVVPKVPTCPQGGGRRRHGDREVLAAIVFVATSGCTWQQLPSAFFGPSGATAHRRFAEWPKARVWAKLRRLVLDELGDRGELDWSRCAIDSVNMRALQRGPGGPESCRPGQVRLEGSLEHRADRSALSVGISGANLHDSQALMPLVQGMPPICYRRGRRRRRPGKFHGDRGYDYDHLRRWFRARGITPRIARKGVDASQRLGRHRWTVARTMAWLAGCRRLHRCYECKASHLLAFTSIACILICYRRLAN
ncbi:IS5 family transposase [Streptomyces sporangiiformans]|uniref:IS5 family transposase n=1 Tax=Streptomyces sporangiiformans TaxID=2315329 RepID=UPI001F08D5C4|nr:IS5 family transposase [Streptomyces sporangiiformans]